MPVQDSRTTGALDAHTPGEANVRNELATPGYALVNLRSSYRWKLAESAGVRLDAGLDKLKDRNYALPLGGRYWIGDKTGKTQLFAMGRSMFSGLTFDF